MSIIFIGAFEGSVQETHIAHPHRIADKQEDNVQPFHPAFVFLQAPVKAAQRPSPVGFHMIQQPFQVCLEEVAVPIFI